MKRFFSNSVKRAQVKGFEVLTSGEMLKVKGGGDIRPATRSKDIITDEGED